METILVLPLYIVLIGGIFWLGDLILAKQKLVMADRYAAWNHGNRQRAGNIQDELQQSLFAPSRVGNQPIQGVALRKSGESSDWTGAAGATVKLKVMMPGWTRSWTSLTMMWDKEPALDSTTLLGRDVDDELHHVLLRRTQYGINGVRTWQPGQLADGAWASKVYQGKWPSVANFGGGGGGDGSPPSVKEYKRFGKYDDWSE
jgi:hypothetical protein